MHPPLCVPAGGGSRGRSSTAGHAYYHNQSIAVLPHNEVSHFFDDSAMDCTWHSAQSPEKPKLANQCKVIPCNTSDVTNFLGTSIFTRESKVDDLLSNELQLDSSPGIFDIHAIDTELLSEEAVPGWWDSGSPYAPITEPGYEIDSEVESCKPFSPNRLLSNSPDTFSRPVTAEKERSVKDNVPAKIKVVVRKRPINKKELVRSEEDIICVDKNGCCLTVHEPKLKVDLTAYVERHEFVFDAILDQDVTNDEVYLETVAPIIPTLFQRTKATCFAYGQTGSGKTYTMQPLPLKASEGILHIMQQPSYMRHGYQLWLSFFEIYGGKLFDLLNDRRKLCMREDGRQQVCIVGLKEFQIFDLDILKGYIERGSLARSTGTTGANEESSRSHAILQLSIKKSSEVNEKQRLQMVGKMSFIDLAGSERGADTTDNDRQTRLEGAEINKSLLALKECIRALDSDQGHIPFRGSKLTEVLRDSFVGDSRTVMISCISPSSGSCEHTLNTLRYADRVKGLSRNSNSKKELSCMLLPQQESSGFPCPQPPFDRAEDRTSLDEIARLNRPSTASGQIPVPSISSSRREVEHHTSALRDALNLEASSNALISGTGHAHKSLEHWQNGKVNMSQQFLWKGKRENKCDLQGTAASKEDAQEERTRDLPKPNRSSCSSTFFNQEEAEPTDQMAALLKEEDNLVSAHCKELEDTIKYVREEMKLLTEVDQPGSQIDVYVSQLSKVLSKKAAGLVNLQAQLARFQKLLKEQEIVGMPTVLQPT